MRILMKINTIRVFIFWTAFLALPSLTKGLETEFEGLMPPNDRDAEAWLKRAKEAADRGDWKLAADTLERLIENHGDATVATDKGRYRSVISVAQSQIANWPLDGLAAYRILYDPEAQRLLELAKRNYDFDALREIARKYPMTTPGPKAIDLLSGWLIDRHQATEAIELLQQLSKLPHHEMSDREILQKRAIAYTLANQRARAAKILKQLRHWKNSDNNVTLPKNWPQHIESMQRFFENIKLDQSRAQNNSTRMGWPYRLGPSSARGRMPHVDPVMAEEDGWSASLPGADRLTDSQLRQIRKITKRQARPPVWQAISDGQRLFVTCPSGLVARDLATFDFLWQAFPKFKRHDPELWRHRQMVMGNVQVLVQGGRQTITFNNNNNEVRLDELSTRTLFREHRGEVSTAFGLVFIIEQDGTPNEQRPTLEGVLPSNAHLDDQALSDPNTLRVYEADTGRLVWSKGRGGAPEDKLKHAHFYAAPVATTSHIIVPYLRRQDLLLAVLKPDGTVVKEVLLGSASTGMFPMNGTLQPTVHDGTIYVPTGAGRLFALNEYGCSLRWLTKYERTVSVEHLAPRRLFARHRQLSIPQADEWLSSPPVIAGGLVLLAPHDSDQLWAFDQEDGALKWSFSRKRHRHRYIVGADDRQILLAGERIEAVGLDTGKSLWKSDELHPSGRPVICGEHVLVPTTKGLIRLNFETGEPIGKRLPTDEPLGNLFVFEGSLYSVGATKISKYPDPEQTRTLAMARLAKNPSDIEAMMRLVWLAMLSKNWQHALELLDRAEDALDDPPGPMIGPPQPFEMSDEKIRSRLAHQRVEALLSLASESDRENKQKLLQQAVAAARRPGDRIRTGLAMIEDLAERDQLLSGFEQALSLLRKAGDHSLNVNAYLRVRADVLIRERMQRYWQDMGEPARAKAARFLNRTIEETAVSAGRRGLERLADNLEFLEQGSRLDLDLGKKSIADGEYETGVYYLSRAARRAAGQELELEALFRLVMTLRFPGEGLPAVPAETANILKRLEFQYADAFLPEETVRAAGLEPPLRVSDFAEMIRSTLPNGLFNQGVPMPRILQQTPRLGLLYEDPESSNSLRDGSSFWDPTRNHDIYAEILPLELSGRIRGLRSDAIEGKWHCWFSDLDEAGNMSRFGAEEANVRPAALAGLVAVLHTPTQVSAVGLTSGRLMWLPLEINGNLETMPDPALLNIDGIIIVAADSSTLVAIAPRDNARPVWRRNWSSTQLRYLRAVDDSLVVVNRPATKAFVLDPQSGRTRREYWLVAGDAKKNLREDDVEAEDDANAHVAIVGRVICRSGHQRVMARDIKTGKSLWRPLEWNGRIKGLYELDQRHLGVCYGANQFAVVRVEAGEVVQEITADGLDLPPIDAVVDFPSAGGGRLTLFAKTDDVPAEYALKSFPLDNDGLPWLRELGQSATISRQMMRASPDYVAVIQNEVSNQDVQQLFVDREPTLDTALPPRLIVVNKVTGMRMTPRPYEFHDGRLGNEGLHRSRRIKDVIVLDKRIIAVAPEGYFVLADQREVDRQDQ